MSVSIRIRLGPMAEISAHGENCREIAKRLEGWKELNAEVERLSVDLGERMYPEDEAREVERRHEPEEAV